MKRNLLLLLIGILGIAAVMLVGNLLIIGQRLACVHPYLEYGFYILVMAAAGAYVLSPVVRILRTPPIPALDEEMLAVCTSQDLYKIGISLAKNNYYIKEKEVRKIHRENLVAYFNRHNSQKEPLLAKITEEMEKRFCEMNAIIKDQALTAFLVTGLSQNGKFDFITTLGINFRMIGQIVATSGFRPTYAQLFKIYTNVLGASFITYFSEEMLDDVDFTSLANTIRLPGILISSVMDGTLTALMTLRIGYIAKKHIQTGSKAFNWKAARRYGIKNARKEIVEVVKSGGRKLRQCTVSGLMSLWKFKNPPAEETNDTKS